ncbi:MAG: hypothetical protein ACK5XO_10240 [Phycisphaerales bacterium]
MRTLADLRGADPSRLFNKLRAANARGTRDEQELPVRHPHGGLLRRRRTRPRETPLERVEGLSLTARPEIATPSPDAGRGSSGP